MAKRPKILIVKIGAMGDILFALPAAAAIKSKLATAEVTWLVGKTHASILAGNPSIDRVVTLDDAALFSGGALQRLGVVLRLRASLGRFDAILIGHRKSAYAAVLAGMGSLFQLARETRPAKWPFAHYTVVTPGSLHESHAMRNLVIDALRTNFGITGTVDWRCDVGYLSSGQKSISLPKRYVVVHVGGGVNSGVEFKLKQWPSWGLLVDRLLRSAEGHVVLVGAPSERNASSAVLRQIAVEHVSRLIDLTGRTTVGELAGVISGATLFLGCDSGPLHLADSIGTPCVGLYGPTSKVSWGLLGASSQALSRPEPCSPCYRDDGVFPACPYEVRCMRDLPPEDVFDAASSLLEAGARGRPG